MNKYNQLREEIIKCCPDIVKLKMGCRVKCVGVYYIYLRAKDNHYTFKCDLTDTIMSFTKKCFDEEFEIIGRDITLEDCLIAMTLNGGSRFNMITYKRGQMKGKIQILREDQKKFIDWELNKPLQDQSEETKDFLVELIVKK